MKVFRFLFKNTSAWPQPLKVDHRTFSAAMVVLASSCFIGSGFAIPSTLTSPAPSKPSQQVMTSQDLQTYKLIIGLISERRLEVAAGKLEGFSNHSSALLRALSYYWRAEIAFFNNNNADALKYLARAYKISGDFIDGKGKKFGSDPISAYMEVESKRLYEVPLKLALNLHVLKKVKDAQLVLKSFKSKSKLNEGQLHLLKTLARDLKVSA